MKTNALKKPSGVSYEPKTRPYEHQKQTVLETWDRLFWGVFAEQGLGKTKITIDTADLLFEEGLIDTVFIVAPNGVHVNWTWIEIPKHSKYPQARNHWNGMGTKRESRVFFRFLESDDLKWYSMNIEALRSKKGFEHAKKLIGPKTLFVVDESTIIKNPKAKQTKACLDLSRFSKFRRILSGTPIVQNPLDIWSQALFLHETALPYRSWTAFKAKYAVEVIRQMQNRSFREIVGFRNIEQLREEVSSFSTRLLKKDCLDLPEKVYRSRFVPFDKEQKRTYDQMVQTQVAFLKEKERTSVVTAQNLITVLNKLRQILCGFIIDEEGTVFDVPTNRLKALDEEIEQYEGKIIIWTTYRESVLRITRHLSKNHGIESVRAYYGDISNDDRKKNVDDFQNPDSPVRFLVANKAASRGLTLTRAALNIYFTNDYNLEDRLQSEDRTHRIGTKESVVYTDFVTPDSVDEKILKALFNKVELNNQVVKTQWREIILNLS